MPLPARAAGLFGTRERFSSDLAPFTKWDKVVARTNDEERQARAGCADGGSDCVAAQWRRFVAMLSRLPLRERIVRANDVLNRVRYVSAVANWDDPDHWETPYEFLAHGGQCEDYAIAKFMALAASGVPDRMLRLVVVHDTETGLDHAVTVVYVDGEAMVLDNQIKTVTPAARIHRYIPYYSINRAGWWYHMPARPGAALRLAQLEP
ncbi:MAG TPA: transglutaminase-like cysteine peptidase [Stellaceae bacterium]|nr:transglutaminase-like cysteine peptidase [Stellaceae bacterium]